ncbi:MAG: bifunctional oligoribonuclease/PAP phosphatase NrnA [Isosphaeraceae bacterium]
MSLDWTPLADLIDAHDRFLVTSHVRPDGDALGSEVGMVGLLRQKGKDVRVVNTSQTPPRYDYLDPNGTLFEHFGTRVRPADLADRQALVIVDLSSWGQLGDMADFVRAFPGPRLVIDHHVSQDDMGATVLKDTTAEATGTLVARAFRALGGTLTPEVATGLLTAIAMDTGWFRHPSTTPETLRTAAELMEAGADVSRIYRLLFERNTAGRLLMMGESLSGLRTDLDGRIAYSAVTREDFERTGAIPPDTEDLVDYTVSLRGVEVGLLFIEQKRGGIKLSIRSREGFDCAALAAQFGGGGHKAAAGAMVPDPLDASLPVVLAAVRRALGAPAS